MLKNCRNIQIFIINIVAYFLWEGGFDNIECLRAIYSHSDGADYHQLSKILFLADKLEPKRHYETATLRKLAFKIWI